MNKKKQKFTTKDPFHQQESSNYDSPILSREAIIGLFKEVSKPQKFEKVITKLNYQDKAQISALKNRLNAMVRDGQLQVNRRGAYTLTQDLELFKGIVSIEKNGYGVVSIPESTKILLPPRQVSSLMHGDVVLVRAGKKMIRGKKFGVLVEVLTRANTTVLGQLVHEQGSTFITPYGRHLAQQNIVVDGERNSAKHGDYVLVTIERFPTKRQPALGKIVKVLGSDKATSLEIELAIAAHGLPHEWPSDVLKEIDKFHDFTVELLPGRQDLRKLPFVTIDGQDAKDYDDAIYVEQHESGAWELYVAIADVSHYVTPDSALDQEAQQRGTSVYFPNHVVPMLPEVLSNGLCSLVPHQDRLVMVAKINVSASGKVLASEFFRGVIHSHARLTYKEVAKMDAGTIEVPEFWRTAFAALQGLYAALITERYARGAIDFNTKETTIFYDEKGRIETIKPSSRTVAHCFIEECMLLANQAVANFLLRSQMPSVFRVHAEPPVEKMTQVQNFLAKLGVKFNINNIQPKQYNRVLQQCQEQPEYELVQTLLLRSMAQANYAAENGGHFGLAFDAYCHFTSPIRRYPDLLVHRAVGWLIDQQPSCYTQEHLAELALHSSFTERRAEDASRSVIARLKCYYMRDKIGQNYQGKIASVTNFGLFVALDDVFVEGLVHITSLPSDYYEFQEERHQLIGKKNQRVFRLGDSISIEVANVSIEQGFIDFELSGNQ